MILERFRYTGQPMSEFPAWLLFRNIAQSLDRQRLVVPRWLDSLELRPGHTLVLLATAEVALADD